jgi:hypothetical protein
MDQDISFDQQLTGLKTDGFNFKPIISSIGENRISNSKMNW